VGLYFLDSLKDAEVYGLFFESSPCSLGRSILHKRWNLLIFSDLII